MDWLTDPWQFEFMRRALLAGALLAVVGAVVGAFVVAKGLAFLGEAVAHSSLAGAAVALLSGGGTVLISLGAGVAAAATALGVTVLSRRSPLREDTAIGLLLAALFGLGVLLLSRARNAALELNALLVGNLLGVSTTDLLVMAVLVAVVIAATIYFYPELLFSAYDPSMAAAAGVPVAVAQAGLLLLVALAAVAAYRVVGVVLVLAMLVAPAATGALLARRLPGIMAVGLVVGLLATVGGLYLGYHADVAAGPAIVMTAVALFALAFLFTPRGLDLSRRWRVSGREGEHAGAPASDNGATGGASGEQPAR